MQIWDPLGPGGISSYSLVLSNYLSTFGEEYHFTQMNGTYSWPVLSFVLGRVGVNTATPLNTLGVDGGVSVDQNDDNDGTNMFPGQVYEPEARGITFGLDSGEGIGSARVDGSPNHYGLDFYTSMTKRVAITADGNVGIGTVTPGAMLDVAGNVKISGTGASLTFPDGSTQGTAYTGTCTATGGDYAESVDIAGVPGQYEPGDVLVIAARANSDIEKSSGAYSTMVAGIYATKPGFIGRRQTTTVKAGPTEIPMAMVGIVPTKVSAENGPVHRGDLLVTASAAGYAMKGTDRSRMVGAVVGKAMGDLESGNGVIEVLVSLQ